MFIPADSGETPARIRAMHVKAQVLATAATMQGYDGDANDRDETPGSVILDEVRLLFGSTLSGHLKYDGTPGELGAEALQKAVSEMRAVRQLDPGSGTGGGSRTYDFDASRFPSPDGPGLMDVRIFTTSTRTPAEITWSDGVVYHCTRIDKQQVVEYASGTLCFDETSEIAVEKKYGFVAGSHGAG